MVERYLLNPEDRKDALRIAKNSKCWNSFTPLTDRLPGALPMMATFGTANIIPLLFAIQCGFDEVFDAEKSRFEYGFIFVDPANISKKTHLTLWAKWV